MTKVKIGLLFLSINFTSVILGQSDLEIIDTITNYNQLSIAFLTAIKAKQNTKTYITTLENISEQDLGNQLNSDNKKLAFWINIYNGFIQVILQEHPEYFEDRRTFFKKPFINIAGRNYSFSQIEHGIIRGSELEYFLGYIKNPFAPKHERKLRVTKREPRVHFALNCGAKSCPPVAIYSERDLDKQFDFMTEKYLKEVSIYNKEENSVRTSPLMSWFRGDFNGVKGLKEFIKKYDIVPNSDVKVFLLDYDWTLYLDNFVEIKL